MPEENKDGSAAIAAGSPDLNGGGPAKPGEPTDVTKVDDEVVKQNEELEKKLGQQGTELGEYRDFVKNITPLLDKLDEQPALIQAILDGKVNQDLIKSALDGKISVKDAADVTTAHDKVKKSMGKEYEGASPDEVETRIKSELDKQSEAFDKKLADSEELRDFKNSVQSFIETTKDFEEYADNVTKFLDENPSVDDISIAYDVVKGRALAAQLEKDGEKSAAQKAKDLAANAAGGGSQGGSLSGDVNVVDQLISGKSNPNNS